MNRSEAHTRRTCLCWVLAGVLGMTLLLCDATQAQISDVAEAGNVTKTISNIITQPPPHTYYFAISPESGWEWAGIQWAIAGLGYSVTIITLPPNGTTGVFSGTISAPSTTDLFNAVFNGALRKILPPPPSLPVALAAVR